MFLLLSFSATASYEGNFQIFNQHCFVGGIEVSSENLEFIKVLKDRDHYAIQFKFEQRIPQNFPLASFQSDQLSVDIILSHGLLSYKSEASYSESKQGHYIEEVSLSSGVKRTIFAYSSVWIVNNRHQKDFTCWAEVKKAP